MTNPEIFNIPNSEKENKDEVETEFLQISQFAKKVGMTVSTVDLWFKRMEEKLIHYIQREEKTERKVYAQLDYEIACFIRDLRDKDKQGLTYSLDSIFEMVPTKFAVRPFPPEHEKTNDANVFDVEAVRRRFAAAAREEMQAEGEFIISQIEGMLANHFNEIKAVKALLDEHTKLLDSTAKIETKEEKEKRLALEEKKRQEEFEKAENVRKERMIQERDTHIMRESAKRKVEGRLRSKALELWMNKSPEERFIKTGFFKKEENLSARDKFVEQYIAENFEDEYRNEFN